MNVLVYSGPGASTEATKQTLETLRLILSPNYAVTTVNELQILDEPWADATAMLVMPGGADLPYCKFLDGKGNTNIKSYVRRGGRFLGICAGGYYGAQNCEFEAGTAMEVTGPRELSFYNGTARGAAYKGFMYGSNAGSRAALVETPEGDKFRCFYNGGSIFEGDATANVILRYVDPVDCNAARKVGAAAAVALQFGKGSVVLTGVHLEYSIGTLDAPDLADSIKDEILHDTEARLRVFRSILRSMGLTVGETSAVPKVTPLYLTSMDRSLQPTVSSTMDGLSGAMNGGHVLTDMADTFVFCEPSKMAHIAGDKIVGVFANAVLPPLNDTPYFNLRAYYDHLRQQEQEMPVNASGIGRTVMYAEIVTSTSSMIDRNPQMLKNLPHGFVSLGSQQTAGRGRGNNVWVNPAGVLPVSGVLRVAKSDLRQSLVFVQYLISMSVVDAFESMHPGYKKLGVRLKWPNDVYIEQDGTYVKIGGVLVSVNFINNTFVLVYGCGTNVSNKAPSTSLNSMIASYNKSHGTRLPLVTQEELLARILSKLDEKWVVFLDLGFQPFEARYYEQWLHSNKIVRLDQYSNVRAMVKGITLDTGMLLVQEVDVNDLPVGATYELQPDGNSFDMLKGLIKKKS